MMASTLARLLCPPGLIRRGAHLFVADLLQPAGLRALAGTRDDAVSSQCRSPGGTDQGASSALTPVDAGLVPTWWRWPRHRPVEPRLQQSRDPGQLYDLASCRLDQPALDAAPPGSRDPETPGQPCLRQRGKMPCAADAVWRCFHRVLPSRIFSEQATHLQGPRIWPGALVGPPQIWHRQQASAAPRLFSKRVPQTLHFKENSAS